MATSFYPVSKLRSLRMLTLSTIGQKKRKKSIPDQLIDNLTKLNHIHDQRDRKPSHANFRHNRMKNDTNQLVIEIDDTCDIK